jgi:hypothetical protein
MRRVVPILVFPFLSNSLLSLSLEPKLFLMTIPTTILTMEADWFLLALWLWFFAWLLSRFPSLLLFNHISLGTHKLYRFLEIVYLGGNAGGSRVVLSLFLRWFGLGGNVFLGAVCGGI